MGEHFSIRYSSAGAVFFLFALMGACAFDAAWVKHVLSSTSDEKVLGASLAGLVAAPAIGVAIHGVMLVMFRALGLGVFTDAARREVAQEYPLIKRITDDGTSETRRTKILRMPDEDKVAPDCLFVLHYYSNAEERLIDWARRRRSYSMLGISYAVAALIGVVAGAGVALLKVNDWAPKGHPDGILIAATVAVVFLWSAGALYLGRLMKHNADGMELAWARDYLKPNTRSAT